MRCIGGGEAEKVGLPRGRYATFPFNSTVQHGDRTMCVNIEEGRRLELLGRPGGTAASRILRVTLLILAPTAICWALVSGIYVYKRTTIDNARAIVDGTWVGRLEVVMVGPLQASRWHQLSQVGKVRIATALQQPREFPSLPIQPNLMLRLRFNGGRLVTMPAVFDGHRLYLMAYSQFLGDDDQTDTHFCSWVRISPMPPSDRRMITRMVQNEPYWLFNW